MFRHAFVATHACNLPLERLRNVDITFQAGLTGHTVIDG